VDHCRIIIVVDLTVIKSGADVGGPIGKPVMLDMVRVDQAPMTTTSVAPQQQNRPGNNTMCTAMVLRRTS
jgi:hypothetical protein